MLCTNLWVVIKNDSSEAFKRSASVDMTRVTRRDRDGGK